MGRCEGGDTGPSHRPVGAAATRRLTSAPFAGPGRDDDEGVGDATYHSFVTAPAPFLHRCGGRCHAWSTRPGRTADLGAIGPDDPRVVVSADGCGSCLSLPPGRHLRRRLIHIGAETIVGPGVSISAGMAPGQEMPTDPVVSIGSRSLIGRSSRIVGHWEIVIGDDIQTGPYVYVTDEPLV